MWAERQEEVHHSFGAMEPGAGESLRVGQALVCVTAMVEEENPTSCPCWGVSNKKKKGKKVQMEDGKGRLFHSHEDPVPFERK